MTTSEAVDAWVSKLVRRHLEIVLAVGTIALGFGWSMCPRTFADQPAYGLMAMLAPQYVWGWVATFLGGLRLAFLIVNGFYPRSPIVRYVLALATLFTVWLPLWASFVEFFIEGLRSQASLFLPGTVGFMMIIWIEGLNIMRLGAVGEAMRGAAK